ncbi:MAG: hypothetical protein V1888_00185 [archaeon]
MIWDSIGIIIYTFDSNIGKKKKSFFPKYIDITSLAMSCGAYPISYPNNHPTPSYFITRLVTGNLLLRYLSYKDIDKKLGVNNSIYVKTDELDYFERVVLPKIRTKFVLVSGGSDCSTLKFKSILKNHFLIHWFAQNNNIEDSRVSSVPIGLDHSSLMFNNCFDENKKTAQEQDEELKKIMKVKFKKKLKVFSNFHLNYTSQRRRELHDLLKYNSCMYFQKNRMPRTKMWKLQNHYTFNFSPVGNGLDCIRTWESLILGQIPIAEKTGTSLDNLYKEFPIVVIDDVSELTEKNLEKWHKKYSKMFTPELERKLTSEYWVGMIKEKANFLSS